MVKEAVFRFSEWAKALREQQPNAFEQLAQKHEPQAMWIGCADARLAIYAKMGFNLGEVFVHRNIANQFGDDSSRAALSYAVRVLGVKDIVICGHYGCGGIQGGLDWKKLTDPDLRSVRDWLLPIYALSKKHREELESLKPQERAQRLAVLNVWEQLGNVCRAPMVLKSWDQGIELSVHGIVFDMANGALLRGLGWSISNLGEYNNQQSLPQPAPFSTPPPFSTKE